MNLDESQPLKLCDISVSVCQVAGRLQVEVWHGTESSEADRLERSDAQQNICDGDPQERKLDCVVRTFILLFRGRFVGITLQQTDRHVIVSSLTLRKNQLEF